MTHTRRRKRKKRDKVKEMTKSHKMMLLQALLLGLLMLWRILKNQKTGGRRKN
jgi:hypothetical protein